VEEEDGSLALACKRPRKNLGISAGRVRDMLFRIILSTNQVLNIACGSSVTSAVQVFALLIIVELHK
jgi:hypothetical protein